MRRLTVLLTAALLVAAGCSGDDDSTAATTVATTAAVTTAAPTSGSATSGGCSTDGDTSPKSEAFPDRMSSLIGKAARVGRFDQCTERFVVELQGTGTLPGWSVQYGAKPTKGESEEPADIAGTAFLVLRAGSWMTTMDGQGYQGPRTLTPKGTTAIQQAVLVENFEGMMGWALGLDEERPFTVSTLTDPPRIVVDVFAG